jgi:hypothetical protein
VPCGRATDLCALHIESNSMLARLAIGNAAAGF